MPNSNPRVTVLMPVYNGERYLRQSIESILGQTFRDFEFLIIDDGSTDASSGIVRSYSDPRIRLIENDKNFGIIKSLNRGLESARGEYIARHDADDISHPGRLEKQVAFLNDHPEIVLLGTGVNIIDQNGRKNKSYGFYVIGGDLGIRWQVILENPFIHPTIMMRTKMAREAGGYDEHFLECEDYDLFSRVACVYKTANLKEALVDYRYHSASIYANRKKENNSLVGDIIRRTFARYMNAPPDEEWINLWLGINNIYDVDSAVDAKKLAQHIESIYDRFISLYPEAQNDTEIKKHISHVLLRISYNITFKDRFASFYCFCRVFKKDIFLACRFLPKYLIALILGRHRVSLSKRLGYFWNMMQVKFT